jgi:hypothetical protein
MANTNLLAKKTTISHWGFQNKWDNASGGIVCGNNERQTYKDKIVIIVHLFVYVQWLE